MRFTMNRIYDLTCPAGKKDALYFDDELPGFGVRVSSGGGKTYLCQYRTSAGVRRMAIGKCSVVSLDAARKAARAILGKAASGHDPVSDRRAKEKVARQKKVEDEFTLDALITAWASDRHESRRASYLKIATAALRTHLQGLLLTPAAQVTVDDAIAALGHVKALKMNKENKGVAANRLLSYARACFGWGVRRQDGQFKALAVNPFGDIERPVREKSRDRVLSDTELGAIWRAADRVDWPAGQFARLLMLTLARRDEVASMRWSELSADGTTWTLPADRAKNGKAHVVHLSEPARAILTNLPRFGASDFVFTTTGSSPISGFSGFKKTIDRAIAADLGMGIADWRFHDFRRAGVTWLADAGFPPHVADRLLNHTAGAISGVAKVYQRGEFLKERKAALDAWASHVMSAAVGIAVSDKVIALRA